MAIPDHEIDELFRQASHAVRKSGYSSEQALLSITAMLALRERQFRPSTPIMPFHRPLYRNTTDHPSHSSDGLDGLLQRLVESKLRDQMTTVGAERC
jgi:hypothetical protein